MNYNDALEFATKKHSGQYRKDGREYIVHPYNVSKLLEEKGYGLDYQVAGLFHDLLEDTDATKEEILLLSTPEVLEAVELVTKIDGYTNEVYLPNIFKNEIAREVKMADRLNNLRDAAFCDDKFKVKYIKETKEYYYPLITGYDFEQDIIDAVTFLANTIK